MSVRTLTMCTLYFVHFDIFGSVEIRHYNVYTSFGVLTLCNLCVICNSNTYHSFIFNLYIMIVHTLKMCTGITGPEQSLVLLFKYCDRDTIKENDNRFYKRHDFTIFICNSCHLSNILDPKRNSAHKLYNVIYLALAKDLSQSES